MLIRESFALKIFYLVWTQAWSEQTDSDNQLSKKIRKTNILEWAGLRRSISLSLRSYDGYPSVNSPTFVLGDNIFDVTKGKSKGHYTLLIRENAKPPKIVQKLQTNFHFNSDHLK